MNLLKKNTTNDLISPKNAFLRNVVGLKIEDGVFFVGTSNVNNTKLITDLKFETGYEIKLVEMKTEDIIAELKYLHPDYLKKNENRNEIHSDRNYLEYSNVEFVNHVIENAIKIKASDIHFETMESCLRIRYRIDGYLKEVYVIPKEKSNAIISRLKIMANLDIAEKRRPQDGKIKVNFNNHSIDIRMSSLPISNGEKIVLRILDKTQLELNLKNLGLHNQQLELLRKKIKLPYGMILVTGPTGSGKTTTLYASLKEILSVEKNIITIEDPIEYNLEGINQCNVKSDIGFDFANALRAFLRQDPDIIMVGEIRDKETAEIAIRASLTGHLVFSTLHTNDSISAISRLIDMGVEPFLVAASVKLIVAQRLVRKLCVCKSEITNEIVEIKNDSEFIFEKKGCSKCNSIGYSGRTAIYELLDINEDLANAITNLKSSKEIKTIAENNNFISLYKSGLLKIIDGITTYEEVLRETTL